MATPWNPSPLLTRYREATWRLGGGDSIFLGEGGSTRHIFLLALYNSKKYWGARAPSPPPAPRLLLSDTKSILRRSLTRSKQIRYFCARVERLYDLRHTVCWQERSVADLASWNISSVNIGGPTGRKRWGKPGVVLRATNNAYVQSVLLWPR